MNDIDSGTGRKVANYMAEKYDIDEPYNEAYRYNSFGEEKYEFCYTKDCGQFMRQLIVYTDKHGNIEDIEQTY